MESSTKTAEKSANMPASETLATGLADRHCRELLLAAAAPPTGADTSRMERLAAQVGDWERLLELAGQHRMLPILYAHLEEMGGAVPAGVRQRLTAEYHRNMIHALANAAEMIELLKVFEQEGIPVMPFKGVVLAASVYGDLAARPGGDMDFLIHHRHLSRATTILVGRGYEWRTLLDRKGLPVFTDNHENQYERHSDGRFVELGWQLELVYGKFRRRLGIDWVWPGRRTATVAGAEVPDLNPEIKLLVLCMHGCKHLWSRLIWICDVARLMSAEPELDWDKAIREARRVGLWRSLALGVLLAHRVAGAPVAEPILRRFESDGTACGMASYFEENLFDAPGSAPKGLVPYNIKLLSFRDRLWSLVLLDFMRPNEHDLEFVRLPRGLRILYWFVRPIRILRGRPTRR
jgi:hypothetical protein